MELVQEPEIKFTFTEDFNRLVWFVKRYNNSYIEYIRVARMYLFGTPIRRLDCGFQRATPMCIRVRLYSSQQKKREVAFIDDEVDFPLEPNGGLNLRRVKLYWGINLSAPLEPYSWKLFKPCKHDQLSGVAVHNLSDGRRNLIELLFNPIESDEYKREELGTWRRELKWRRRVLADDPVWYMNRLVALCFLWWLLSLIPEALGAAWSAAVALLVTASLAVQWARSLMLSVPSRARTQSF